jgi:hypothetical protein
MVVTWEHHQMVTKCFWSPNFLSALNFTYIKGFAFSFFLTFFSMCVTLVVLDNLSATFKKGGGGGELHVTRPQVTM